MNKLQKKESIILEVLSEFYIAIMIIVYPLIVDKTGFFHILECKWYSYLIISSSYLICIVFVLLYFQFIKKNKFLQTIKISKIQWFAIAFIGINVISCFLSPFYDKYNLFIGVGRGEGLIMMLLYSLTFLSVSLFAKFKKRYILFFSIASICISFIAILQYVGFNPFNMYKNGIGTHNVSFMGTIGNVSFISAMYCLLMPVSFSAFIFLENDNKYNKLIHLLSIFMGTFIFGIINVQSGKVAFLLILTLLLPFIFMNNKRLSRFLIMISTVLAAYCINVIINPEYHYDIKSLDLYFQFNYLALLFLIVIGILIFLAFKLKKIKYEIPNFKKKIKYFYLCILGIGLLSLIVVYFYDFNSGILYEFHEILHGNFDDDFGTYRIFLWKRTFQIFPEYPLIGSGPDSFAIRFMAKYAQDIAAIGPLTLNDTAANVYFTMLINIGITGLGIYLLFIYSQIKKGIQKINIYSSLLLITIICYLIQDFFNLSVVIVTPIFWLLMALHFKSIE